MKAILYKDKKPVLCELPRPEPQDGEVLIKVHAAALNRALENRLLPEGSNFITQEKLNKWDVDFAIDKIKQNTRIYSRKQMTWFRRDTAIHWFDAGDGDGVASFVSSLE